MMRMEFSFEDYQRQRINYLAKHSLYNTLDRRLFTELLEKQKQQGLTVERTLEELKKRTTDEYYRKVDVAQEKAMTFAKKVFPTYKFIMPDALTDDWLSTMDWHKSHQTRDHSLHQTLTAYIVSTMLGNGDPTKGLMLSDEESLLSRCAKLMTEGEKMSYLREYLREIDTDFAKHQDGYDYDWAVDVFYETALLAAQFHDMGYPWQFINTLAKELRTNRFDKMSGMLMNEDRSFEFIKERLLVYPFFGYQAVSDKRKNQEKEDKAKALLKKGIMQTHGVPGALGFMCLNNNFQSRLKTNEMDKASNWLVLDWAAVGIMMHDMPGLYWGNGKETGTPEEPILRLDFETDPLSCIISMADILEEFERPNAIFDEVKEDDNRVKVGYGFACRGSRIEIDGGHLRFIYLYDNESQRRENEKWRENEVNEYLNPQNGYLDLSSWGIEDVVGKTEVV